MKAEKNVQKMSIAQYYFWHCLVLLKLLSDLTVVVRNDICLWCNTSYKFPNKLNGYIQIFNKKVMGIIEEECKYRDMSFSRKI